MRLVNGPTSNKGRVEIYYDYQWGTICDDYWSDTSAQVVCHQLGYPIGYSQHHAYYGRGTGPIVLDDVQCKGDELRLLDCTSRAPSEHNCQHSEDAGAECYMKTPTEGPNQGDIIVLHCVMWGICVNDLHPFCLMTHLELGPQGVGLGLGLGVRNRVTG